MTALRCIYFAIYQRAVLDTNKTMKIIRGIDVVSMAITSRGPVMSNRSGRACPRSEPSTQNLTGTAA
jgi:hypothetical protein